MLLVGLHGPHGVDDLLTTLNSVRKLISYKPRDAELIICGDWNIDLLASFGQ